MRTIDLPAVSETTKGVVLCYACGRELLTVLASAKMERHYHVENQRARNLTITIEPCPTCIASAVRAAKPKSDLDRK